MVAYARKQQFGLSQGILCHFYALHQRAHLALPDGTFLHVTRPFPSTLSLPREIWLDLTEWCHWYTLQQSYINLPKLQSITLCKAASAICIAEMEKKKFYRSLPVLKVVLFWVVCLFLRWTELAFLVVLILDKRTLHFQRKEGYVQAVQTLIPQRFAHLVKKKQFGTSQTFSSR